MRWGRHVARSVRGGLLGMSCVGMLGLVGCRATTEGGVRPEDDPNAVIAPDAHGPKTGPAKPPATKPPVKGPQIPAEVERWGKLTRELGENIRRSGGTCSRVAGEVQSFIARHRKDLATLERARETWEKTAPSGTVRTFYVPIQRDLDARIDAGIKCSSDPLARQAFDAFFVAAGLDTSR